MSDLMPCPFCGDNFQELRDPEHPFTGYRIRCKQCGGESGAYGTPEMAAKAWNTRKAPAANPGYERLEPGEPDKEVF